VLAAALAHLGQPVVIVRLGCRGITFAGLGDDLGVEVQDLLQLIAQRLADTDRLAAKA